MGKYNVIGSFIAGQEARRAADEQNYISERRKIEDPLKDKQASRVDAARQGLVDQYGVQAGDPTSYGQVRGTQRADDLHPAEVEQAGLRTTGMKLSNEGQQIGNDAAAFKAAEAEKLAAREGMGRLYAAMGAAGVNDRATANAWLAAQTPENLQRITGQPTDPAKIPQLLDQLDAAPEGFEAGLRAQRTALGNPEKFRQIITGMKDGKPVYEAISDEQAPGTLDVRPGGPNDDLERQLLQAQIGQANRANQPKGVVSPEDQAAKLDSLLFSIGDMKTVLGEASRSGAITNDQGDFVSNLFSGDNPAGRFVGQLTGDPKETLRTQIDNKATALLNALIHMDGSTSSRLFDSNAEKDLWLRSLGVGGSYQARLKAVEDFERLAKARMADPRRAGRAPLDAAGPAQQEQPTAQVGGGNLQQRQDGVFVWTPGTD